MQEISHEKKLGELLESKKVLLVKLSQQFTDFFQKALRVDLHFRYEFFCAETLVDGLHFWRSQDPDLVLVGDKLQDGTGFDFLKAIALEYPDGFLPVVMIADHGNAQDAVRCMKLGAADYLSMQNLRATTVRELAHDIFAKNKLSNKPNDLIPQLEIDSRIISVLILDDSESDRYTYSRYLKKDKSHVFNILEASTLAEGLDVWRQQKPDIAIVDLNLSDGSGLEFLEEIEPNPINGKLPVLMLTGYGNDRVAVNAIKLGAADFFTKNKVIPEELIRSVCKTYERHVLGHHLRRLQQQDSLITDIALRVRTSINLDDVLNGIVQEVNHFLMADRTMIYRFDPHIGGKITAEALLHPWESCKNVRDECLDENYLDFYVNDHYVAVNDIYEANLSDCHLNFLEQLQICSYLAYPLTFPEEIDQQPCFRLLIIHQCGHKRVWTEDDIRFLKQLSAHVAIALQQAELYHNLQTANQKLAAEITEHKQTQIELTEAKEKAEMAAIAKGNFLANMSHEIRTPMNGVLGMLYLLASGNLNTEQQAQVAIAQSSGKALLRLINDILDFSKIEAGKLEIEHQPFSLHRTFGETLQSFQIQAQEKGLDLILDLTQAAPLVLDGDAARLRQIVTNLVGNALKFTATGSIIVQVQLEKLQDCYQLKTRIKDSGIGIAPEKLTQLFLPFTQVDSSTTRQYGGTGLGLTITKQICELMGGSITMESTIDVGSCVEFILPFQKTNKVPEFTAPQTKSTFKILVFVVNDYLRKMFCDLLSSWGLIAIAVGNKEEALDLYEQAQKDTPFKLILIDQGSKEVDNFALIQTFKNKSIHSPASILFLGNIDQIPQTPMENIVHLSRPVIPQDIYEIVEKLQGQQSIITNEISAPDKTLPLLPKSTDILLEKTLQNIRILLIEDNRVNQMVAKGLMKKEGLSLDIAKHGLDGIEKLLNSPQNTPYSLILMDCLMPEMDGYEATRQIRAGKAGDRYRNIPIIALTANAMKDDQAKCLAAGMDDYLSKPINPTKLRQKLNLLTKSIESIS